MEKRFIYKEKNANGLMWGGVAFVVIAVLCVYFGWGIGIRNFNLLPYPYSAIVTALIAVVFGVFYFLEKKKEKASKANPDVITLSETGITYTTPKSEVTIAYADVKKLSVEREMKYVEISIITQNDDDYKWGNDGFESKTDFLEFEHILKERCTNATIS